MDISTQSPDTCLTMLKDLHFQLKKCSALGPSNDSAVANVRDFIPEDLIALRRRLTSFSNEATAEQKDEALRCLEQCEALRCLEQCETLRKEIWDRWYMNLPAHQRRKA